MVKMPARMLRRAVWQTVQNSFFRPAKPIEPDTDFVLPFTPEEIATAQAIETLCLPLGPYRNLTSILAAIYALHPQAFVLNHAGVRIWKDASLDFFASDDPERWRSFALAATRMAQYGRRGEYGGSILHSHAFDNSTLLDAYKQRFGTKILPEWPRTLFWKESMGITNRLRTLDFDFSKVKRMPVRVRFILPIRSPLDCAVSTIKTGHYLDLSATPLFTEGGVLRKIVDFYAYANRQMEKFPELFFMLSELDLNAATLGRLGAFSGLDDDEAWTGTILKTVKFDKHYNHSPEKWAQYKNLVTSRLGTQTPLARALLAFCER